MAEATPKSKPKKSRGVLLALLLLLVAIAVVAAAVVWAGGIEGVTELLGLDGSQDIVISPGGTTSSLDEGESMETTTGESVETTPSTGETPTVESESSDGGGDEPVEAQGTFPTGSAMAAMYREQLQSQGSLTDLADNKWSSFTMGTPNVSATRATVPITATYRSGSSLGGSMTLSNSDGMWYFSSFAGVGDPAGTAPRAVDAGVVSTIASQQASEANQQLIQDGIIEHGFTKARVDGVAKGSGTATVNVTLLGGALDRKAARFVMISKEDSGKKYWFVTRFELK